MSKLISRRAILSTGLMAGAAAALPGWSRVAFAAAPTDRRLVVVILRGALDGLSALPPIGDPTYAGLRGDLAIPADEALKLNDMFGLHPALTGFKGFYDAGELIALHGVAIPVRERSHFAAQAILETGLGQVGGKDGWLNRALGAAGWRDAGKSVAFSAAMPLILTGAAPATSFMPSGAEAGSPDFMARVASMYQSDAMLGPALAKGLEVEAMASAAGQPGMNPDDGGMNDKARQASLVPVAVQAAAMMARADGPRIAVMEAYGWDTHVGQGAGDGQLARRLTSLDAALSAFARGMGAAWRDTAVVVVTEFGRTAHPNGNGGTDHGTAGAAFLLGGAVKGGQVMADWPGLNDSQLFEGRDLAPTLDMRALFKGVLSAHLGLDGAVMERDVFPDSAQVRALGGLIKA